MENVIEQQYILAKKANISVFDSGNLTDFERDIYYNLIVRDARKEEKELEKINNS
jgi:hypothetical protein